MGIRMLHVEVDCMCVTQLLQSKVGCHNDSSPLVSGIQKLWSRNWHVSLRHVYREANFSIDFLANHALSLPIGLHLLNFPPGGIESWLRSDYIGIVLKY